MSHEILPSPHDNIVVMRIFDNLTYADMTCENELGLNTGQPIYILAYTAQIELSLPEHFLDAARESFFMHPNLAHMAIYQESRLLRSVSSMVAKLTRRQDKLSLHDSYAAAEAHLLTLMKAQGI